MNLPWQKSCFLVLSVNSAVIKSDAGIHREYISISVLFYVRSYILLSGGKPKSLPTVHEAIWWLSICRICSVHLSPERGVCGAAGNTPAHTTHPCCGWQWWVLGRPRGWERVSLPHPLGGRDLLSASRHCGSTSPHESKFHWILGINYQLAAMFS